MSNVLEPFLDLVTKWSQHNPGRISRLMESMSNVPEKFPDLLARWVYEQHSGVSRPIGSLSLLSNFTEDFPDLLAHWVYWATLGKTFQTYRLIESDESNVVIECLLLKVWSKEGLFHQPV
jgi:hypothetical protein